MREVEFYCLFSLLALCATILMDRARAQCKKVLPAVLLAASILLAGLSKEVGLFFALALPGLYFILFVFLPSPRKLFLAVQGAALLAGLLIGAVFFLRTGGELDAILKRLDRGFVDHLLIQVTVFWRYVLLAVMPLPSRLNVDHDVPLARTFLSDPAVLVSFLALLLVLLAGVLLARRRPTLSFLLLMVPLGVAPYFFMTSQETMVEYRFYLSLTAFCALAAWLLEFTLGRVRFLLPAATVALCLALAAGTFIRNDAWRTDLGLWTDAQGQGKSPHKARTLNALAWR